MKIQTKLSLSLSIVALVITVYMVFFIQKNFARDFLDYVNSLDDDILVEFSPKLGKSWGAEKSWQFIHDDNSDFFKLYLDSLPAEMFNDLVKKKIDGKPRHFRQPKGKLPDLVAMPLLKRTYIFNSNMVQVYGYDANVKQSSLIPVYYNNAVVGYLGHHPLKVLNDKQQLELLHEQKIFLFVIGIAACLITIGLSIPLAHRLTKPIVALSVATRAVAQGNLSTRTKVSSHDEIGQLADDFNSMAASLENHDRLRKQWFTDISHELRTPLTVLRGELESFQDGVRVCDAKAVDDLHRQVIGLSRLVDDLYQLSKSDIGHTYNKEKLDFLSLVEASCHNFKLQAETANLSLEVIVAEGDFFVLADMGRMKQVIDNILGNSVQYTDAGGKIKVNLKKSAQQIVCTIDDSSPGTGGEFDRIFERLYRVEKSRNKHLGGAGIGLALCRTIIEEHGGDIKADQSGLGGLQIVFTLPEYK